MKTPAEYQAVPIDMAIEYLLEQKDRENADLKNKSAELLASIAAQQKEEPAEDFRIMLVPEWEQFIWFTKDKLAAVKSSLEVVMTSHKFSGWTFVNSNIFRLLLVRG